MLYKINNIYLNINKEMVLVGVVLVDRNSLHTEEITNSEYEEGLKTFKYGGGICSESGYTYGTIVGNKIQGHIDQKWIDELKRLGYHTELLERSEL